MNKLAVFFLIIFSGFLIGPTLITYVDKSVDVSLAFTASEEENSAKNHVVLEFVFQENQNSNLGYQFLLQKSSIEHYYHLADNMVFLEVSSPPPRHI